MTVASYIQRNTHARCLWKSVLDEAWIAGSASAIAGPSPYYSCWYVCARGRVIALTDEKVVKPAGWEKTRALVEAWKQSVPYEVVRQYQRPCCANSCRSSSATS